MAEAGHLAAAYLEWPEATARGIYHVAAGALLGMVAAAYSVGASRLLLAAGTGVAVAGPVLWLGGILLDASPYHLLPAPVAIGTTVSEAALAAVLLAHALPRLGPDQRAA